MWNRKILKEEAQKLFTFKDNYWKMVLVGLILILLSGGIGGAFGGFSGFLGGYNNNKNKNNQRVEHYEYNYHDSMGHDIDISDEDIDKYLDKYMEEDINKYVNNGSYEDGKYYAYGRGTYDDNGSTNSNPFVKFFSSGSDAAAAGGLVAGVVIFSIIISLVSLVTAFVIKAFAINPIILGGKSFFLKAYDRPADLKDLGNGFKIAYMSNVKTLFFKDLYTFLWSLLFVIPGIIKAYEYRMMPFLIAENPNMTTQEAFAKSKEMMMGNKWDAFVYDLSFLGWFILNSLTCGILGLFYVNPYYYAADANLYRAIKMGGSTGFVSSKYAPNPQPMPGQPMHTMQGQPMQEQQAPMQGQTVQTQEMPAPEQAPTEAKASVEAEAPAPEQAPTEAEAPVEAEAPAPEQPSGNEES